MTKQELIQNAIKSVVNEFFEETKAFPFPIIGIKLDHIPEGDWDHVENAVLISYDESGNIHLFLMTCEKYKSVIEYMFKTEIENYIMIDSIKIENHNCGHIVIDNADDSEMYLRIIKNDFSLESIQKSKIDEIESKLKFPGWKENINYF